MAILGQLLMLSLIVAILYITMLFVKKDSTTKNKEPMSVQNKPLANNLLGFTENASRKDSDIPNIPGNTG